MNRTTTLKIRSQLLKPYRQVAKILGIPVASYLERYLQTLSVASVIRQWHANDYWAKNILMFSPFEPMTPGHAISTTPSPCDSLSNDQPRLENDDDHQKHAPDD
jgi:hypothetical protein